MYQGTCLSVGRCEAVIRESILVIPFSRQGSYSQGNSGKREAVGRSRKIKGFLGK